MILININRVNCVDKFFLVIYENVITEKKDKHC